MNYFYNSLDPLQIVNFIVQFLYIIHNSVILATRAIISNPQTNICYDKKNDQVLVNYLDSQICSSLNFRPVPFKEN